MILFLDTSVLLAACGSDKGAARFVCLNGARSGWSLLTSGYCVQETLKNLPKVGESASGSWTDIVEPVLEIVPDAVAIGERVLVFPKAKDRPVVISALAARAAALLTLDRTDFHGALGPQVYGMAIRTPAEFLTERRREGVI